MDNSKIDIRGNLILESCWHSYIDVNLDGSILHRENDKYAKYIEAYIYAILTFNGEKVNNDKNTIAEVDTMIVNSTEITLEDEFCVRKEIDLRMLNLKDSH